MTGQRPLALVTGASSGIGQAYAERLAADGWDLIACGRRADRLQDLASRLNAQNGAATEVIAGDLGDAEGLKRVAAACRERELEMLVNNAGLAHYMPFTELSPEQAEELVRVNVLAPTLLARAALTGMVARGRGTIINLASLLAFSEAVQRPGMPQRAVYAGTRSYIVTFTRILAAELTGTGVRVQFVCPGIVRTEFHARQGIETTDMPMMEPADIVRGSLAGLETGEVVCAPSLEDPSAFDRRDQANTELLQGARNTELADRYLQS
jgi:short-subunit dehydrogenase